MQLSGDHRMQALMRESENELWAAFRRGSQFANMGDRGTVRETALIKFLKDQLPARFASISGEVVDGDGSQSGQTDVLIYDRLNTQPLVRSGAINILPAEALLATVEVKSRLTKDETVKVVEAIRKMRVLRPWDAPWAVARRGGQPADDRMPRIFANLFAYESDLTENSWGATELSRFRTCAQEVGVPTQYLDRLVVLDRGILLPSEGSGCRPTSPQSVLGLWFFQLASFLAREVARRDQFPWERYRWHESGAWTRIDEPILDAPKGQRATASDRLEARKRRNGRRSTPSGGALSE